MAKFLNLKDDPDKFVFFCPGCQCAHYFQIGSGPGPRWTWNGDIDKPTVRASILTYPSRPEKRCHSFITDGKIEFLQDCVHELKGQIVELPDFDTLDEEDPARIGTKD